MSFITLQSAAVEAKFRPRNKNQVRWAPILWGTLGVTVVLAYVAVQFL
jgi:hypothetical protein